MAEHEIRGVSATHHRMFPFGSDKWLNWELGHSLQLQCFCAVSCLRLPVQHQWSSSLEPHHPFPSDKGVMTKTAVNWNLAHSKTNLYGASVSFGIALE